MPDVVQTFTYLIPLRYFLVILRGIFLKGVGLEVLWPEAAALPAWGLAILTLATLRSRKRLAEARPLLRLFVEGISKVCDSADLDLESVWDPLTWKLT